MMNVLKFMQFTQAVLKAVAIWLLPFTAVVLVASQIYAQIKAAYGFQDAGLGWAIITLALVVGVSQLGPGKRLQVVYEQHFGREP